MFAKTVIAIVFVAIGLEANGQSSADQNKTALADTTTATHNLPDVTVTGLLIGDNAQKTTGSVSTIDRGELDKRPVLTLPDMLNQATGVVAQQGSAGTQKVMIRGIGSRSMYGTNRIKAYYGQIPLTNAEGVTSLDELALSDIGNTEIIKGPSSALYGSGLGGAIVFKPYDSNNASSIGIRYNAASFGTHRLAANGSLTLANHFVSAGISASTTDGYRQNSASDHKTAHFLWRYNGQRLKTDVLLLTSAFMAQIPSSLNIDQFTDNPQMAAPNWLLAQGFEENRKTLLGVTCRYDFNNRFMAWATVYGNWNNGYEHRPFNVLDDKSTLRGAKAQIDKTLIKWHFSLGAERFTEQYDAAYYQSNGTEKAEPISANQQQRTQTNIYVWAKYAPQPKLTLTAGANLNTLDYSVSDNQNPTDQHHFEPVLSPRIGINYNIYRQTFVYASAGHGLSHPSTEETLMPPGTINRELKPEQGNTVELGIRGTANKLRISYDVTWYMIWLTDQLLTKRVDEATFYGVNGGSSQLQGFEAMVKYDIWESTNKQSGVSIDVLGWKSHNVFADFIDDGNDFTGNQLPGIPAYTFQTNVVGRLRQNWQLAFSVNGWGKQWLNDSNSKQYGAWTKSDIKLSYSVVNMHKATAKFELGALNLFDKRYASMVLPNAPSFGNALPRYYYPALPRQIFAAIILGL